MPRTELGANSESQQRSAEEEVGDDIGSDCITSRATDNEGTAPGPDHISADLLQAGRHLRHIDCRDTSAHLTFSSKERTDQ
ncbi:unnamed protein product [Strongylus vulgaris]|uniref:Uncharacterized protein n=1 Tax=Strongylus vulgaris TaxID=40348 RepID=A0A3P7KKV9_STRVU|nr:unnamed protein product [Strongylus vulgaris]